MIHQRAPGRQERARSCTGPTLLVVEDDPDHREVLALLLASRGFRVEVARDGRQATERLEHLRPDLVITDAMMPFLDGLGLLRWVKQDPRTRSIPVIFVSATGDPSVRANALSTGACAFVDKPFLIDRLEAVIADVLPPPPKEAATAAEATATSP